MRPSTLLSGAVLLAATALVGGCQTTAATAPDPEPAGNPILQTNAPRAPVSVLVLPFGLIGNAPDGTWISEAIEGDLNVELRKNAAVTLIPQPDQLPATEAQAIQAARTSGAQFVVYGAYQYVNSQVRMTGAVLNASDGSILTPLSATGDIKDLFPLEDQLVAQVQHVLPAPPPQPAVAQAPPQEPEVYYPSNIEPQAEAPEELYVPDYDSSPYFIGSPFLFAGGYYGGIGYYGGGFYGGFPRGGFRGTRGISGPRGGFNGGFHGNAFGNGFGAGGFHGGGFGGGRR